MDLHIPDVIFETPQEVMEDAVRRPNAPGVLYRRQVNALLHPIQPDRVQRDPGGNSYVEGHDILAHLTRIFGFGRWSREVVMLECAAQWRTEAAAGVPADKVGRYNAVYRSTCRLTVKDIAGRVMSVHEDAATFTSTNQKSPGDAHDLALKGAVSTALKRAARDWGDQFGLGLYWKGALDSCITWSLGVTLPASAASVVPPSEDVVPPVPAAAPEIDPSTSSEDPNQW
jgi:hypothetical protein